MKKSYSQPEIVFESFSLCSSIAAGCTKKNGSMYNGECGFEMGTRFLFLEGITGCTTVIEDGSFFDGICYHVPTADKVLFNS